MSCAFNLDLIYDFSKQMTAADSFKILHDYRIRNLYETETDKSVAADFNAELMEDYMEGRANFLSYLRPDMDARIVWELRKSAILWHFMGEKNAWFFEAHKTNWGVSEIKHYRTSVLSRKFIDYDDLDWQYFWVLWCAYPGGKWKGIVIDGEYFFEDRDLSKPDQLGDPIRDLAWRITKAPGYTPKIIV